MKTIFPIVSLFFIAVLVCASANAQTVYFNTYYKLEPIKFDAPTQERPFFEPPQISNLKIDYPDQARKNGVQGTVKATAVLGEDGKTREVVIDQDLPFGIGAAVTAALQKLSFKPAAVNGKVVPVTLHIEYVITLAYSEDDKDVVKPEITDKPQPEYPSKYLADKVKGEVTVQVLFNADGTVKVGSVHSVMPQEFDKLAAEAAGKIKFQPAVHKKSHQPVTQQLTVKYEFTP